MRLIALLAVALLATPATMAADCYAEASMYRQDVEGATGWNQILPVALTEMGANSGAPALT